MKTKKSMFNKKAMILATLFLLGVSNQTSALERNIDLASLNSKSKLEKKVSNEGIRSNIFMNTFVKGYSLKLNLANGAYISSNSPGLRDYFSTPSNRFNLHGECAKLIIKGKDNERRPINLGCHLSSKKYFADVIYSMSGMFKDSFAYFTGGLKTGISKKDKNLELEVGVGARSGNTGSKDERKKIGGSLKLIYNLSSKWYDLKSTFKAFVTTQYSRLNNSYEPIKSYEAQLSILPKTSDNVKPVFSWSYKQNFMGQKLYNFGLGVIW